ncbi:MAG: 3-phosphoshikimate 1-carboxyvinyltransferase [Candidatus Omnitrophica bacterium]|nr:3-phosphoshikimate 1-carboxyvinyltransferase [Candidatus Omnitrophota bacterium]
MKIKIKPVKKIVGDITVPGDKSISHRALMIGSLAMGSTKIEGLYLESDDCNYTAQAFRDMGINIREEGDITIVDGKGLHGLKKPGNPLYVGNSGTSMRILAGILAGQNFESTITGGAGISARPMKRVVEPLSMMGVKIRAKDGEYPPLTIAGGKVRPIIYKNLIASAQIKSAILFAGLYAKGNTRVVEPVKSRDHTERMLKYFGAKIKIEDDRVSVRGGGELKARSLRIPGDISSASFFMIAATLLKGSRVKIRNVSINPTRAGILKVLSMMGSDIRIINKKKGFEPAADIVIKHSRTHGITITKDMMPSIIDELPVIFVLASLSEGITVIEGAGELRVKETDRIASMRNGLKAMGAGFRVKGDNIVIEGIGRLKGADLQSFGDHRTCMALAVAALTAEGDSEIEGAESVSKSFPSFFDMLFKLTSA